MEKPTIKIVDLLDYEINSSAWAGLIDFKWGQDLAGVYFSWKVKRKHRRYLQNKVLKQEYNHDINQKNNLTDKSTF